MPRHRAAGRRGLPIGRMPKPPRVLRLSRRGRSPTPSSPSRQRSSRPEASRRTPSRRRSSMCRSLLLALNLPLCALLLTGCENSSTPVVVKPQPGAGLLTECIDPPLVSNPETATDNDIALERVKVAQAYLDCKQKHSDLAKWVRGEK